MRNHQGELSSRRSVRRRSVQLPLKLWCSKGKWVTFNFEHKFQGKSTTLGVRKLESLGYQLALFAWFYV